MKILKGSDLLNNIIPKYANKAMVINSNVSLGFSYNIANRYNPIKKHKNPNSILNILIIINCLSSLVSKICF